MRYLLIFLFVTISGYAQRGDGMMLASYAQANQGTVTVVNVDDITNLDVHDAEESDTGTMVVSSSDLELNYGGTAAKVGVFFDGLNIPIGATITDAYIEFTPERTEATAAPSLTIVGQKGANPSVFTTTVNNITSRPTTTTSVAWNSIGTWTDNVINANSTTPDISSVLQEIIDDGSYSDTHNIVIIFEPGGGTSRRRGEDFSITGEAPHLFVTYEINTGPPPADAILAVSPDLYYNPSSIDPTATSDEDAISVWNDLSGNGLNATSVNTVRLQLNGGTERMVEFIGGNSWMDVADDASLNYTMGTDSFTIIYREGATIPTTGYAVSKATVATATRQYGLYYQNGIQWYRGGTNSTITAATTPSRRLIIAVVTGSTSNVYVDGVLTGGANTAVGSGMATGQSLNIGGRSDGGFLVQSGAHLDLVAFIPTALTAPERAAIEAEWQIN